MNDAFSSRRIVFALGGAVAVIALGTILFHRFTHEGWVQAFYRSVVTSSLTGLDTVPQNNSTRLISAEWPVRLWVASSVAAFHNVKA